MDVRKFTWTDLPQLTRLINLGNAEEEHWLTEALLKEDLARPGLFPEINCTLFESDGELEACFLIHPEISIGRAVLQIWIRPDHHIPDLEGTVVRAGITHAANLGARVLHTCVPSSEFWPGVLAKEKLAQVRTYWLMRWQEPVLPSQEIPKGYSLAHYQPGDAQQLTEIQNAAFGGHWGFSPNTVEEITYRAGMTMSPPEGILLLKHGDVTAGYCWTCVQGKAPHEVGIISMIGIEPTYRGQGLSKPVLLAGMSYLLSQGVEYVKLDVDSQNTPAVKLYLSVGFKTTMELHWFEASLSGGAGRSAGTPPR